MIHGYHLILPMYGFWLPNDPRGSWSDFVRKWELARFGKATISAQRKTLDELSSAERIQREQAKESLLYPAVALTGLQAAGIGRGFQTQIDKAHYTIWACAILPEHVHLVVARHHYRVEQVANLLKGSATRQLIDEDLHPLADKIADGNRLPGMWARRQWKVYLDSELAIDEAIHYVQLNPEKEGKPFQNWSFVTPFQGLPKGGWTTYR